MSSMKNTLGGINSRVGMVEGKISEFEDITTDTIQNETQREKTGEKPY